jgi:hypothetical protein
VSELIDGRKVSHLEVVAAEAEVVRRIFEDICNGVSQRSIARALNAEGAPTSTGAPWSQSSVGAILRNPLYKGKVRHNGEEFDGKHDEIVTAQLWDDAAKTRSSAARRKGGRWPKGSHLLTGGLLRCHCGSALIPRTDRNRRGGNYEVYICSGRGQFGLDHCDQRPIDRALIDEAMLDELGRSYLDLTETRRRLEAKLSADATIAAAAVAEADADAQRAEARLARVIRAFQDGHLEAADYAEQRRQLLGERDGAHAAVQRAKDHQDRLKAAGPLADAEEAVLRRLADLRGAVVQGISQAPDLNALRTIIRQMFEAVLLLPTNDPRVPADWGGSGTEAGDYLLLPILHDEAILTRDGLTATAVRRPALPLETDHDTLHR